MPKFQIVALSTEVIGTSMKVSLFVGTLLALINHGEGILEGTLTKENLVQIALTYLVPYCVATYSSVKAIRKRIAGVISSGAGLTRP